MNRNYLNRFLDQNYFLSQCAFPCHQLIFRNSGVRQAKARYPETKHFQQQMHVKQVELQKTLEISREIQCYSTMNLESLTFFPMDYSKVNLCKKGMRTLSKASLILEKAPLAKVLNFDGFGGFLKSQSSTFCSSSGFKTLTRRQARQTRRGGEKNSQV